MEYKSTRLIRPTCKLDQEFDRSHRRELKRDPKEINGDFH